MFKRKEKPVEEAISETVNEVLDGKEAVSAGKPGKVGGKLDAMVRRHAFLVGCICVAAVCFVVSNMFSGSGSGRLEQLSATLTEYRNETARMTTSLEDVKTEVEDVDYGLDSARLKDDVEWMDAWISDAFTWANADDYNAKRAIYVERLGANHPFVSDFMPPYEPQVIQGADGQVTMGTELNGHVDSQSTYLTKIDEATGTYSYVMVLTQVATNLKGESSSKGRPVILTYDIAIDDAGTRSVRNFIAVPGI